MLGVVRHGVLDGFPPGLLLSPIKERKHVALHLWARFRRQQERVLLAHRALLVDVDLHLGAEEHNDALWLLVHRRAFVSKGKLIARQVRVAAKVKLHPSALPLVLVLAA
eukprot:Amastigsp_a852261_12.p2 type:complete len:109 gc:universal Amastigsp_a852261_12:449-123(-)